MNLGKLSKKFDFFKKKSEMGGPVEVVVFVVSSPMFGVSCQLKIFLKSPRVKSRLIHQIARNAKYVLHPFMRERAQLL